MIDIAIAVEYLLPAAEYTGSVTANTKASWDAVVWKDERREKPTWDELESAQAPYDVLQVAFTAAIQNHLDAFAQTRNYDGIMSVATYANSTNPKFRTEGQYAVEARDATWDKAYSIMEEVLTSQRPTPTLEDIPAILAELPLLEWPA